MKTTLSAVLAFSLLIATPVLAGGIEPEDVLIGALGGGIGAAIGSHLGGQQGAIIGGAIGGAAGSAIVSNRQSKVRREVIYVDRPVIERRVVHVHRSDRLSRKDKHRHYKRRYYDD
jgi:uncharacterized protein YcfJ